MIDKILNVMRMMEGIVIVRNTVCDFLRLFKNPVLWAGVKLKYNCVVHYKIILVPLV